MNKRLDKSELVLHTKKVAAGVAATFGIYWISMRRVSGCVAVSFGSVSFKTPLR